VCAHCELLQTASRIVDDWQVRPVVVAKTDSDARVLGMVAAGLGACLLFDSLSHEGVAFARLEKVELSRRLGLEMDQGDSRWLARRGGRPVLDPAAENIRSPLRSWVRSSRRAGPEAVAFLIEDVLAAGGHATRGLQLPPEWLRIYFEVTPPGFSVCMASYLYSRP
jgi:hypothetical protein